jgi:hypothetical protein
MFQFQKYIIVWKDTLLLHVLLPLSHTSRGTRTATLLSALSWRLNPCPCTFSRQSVILGTSQRSLQVTFPGMRFRVARYKPTGISEESTTPIFRFKNWALFAACFLLLSSLAYSSALSKKITHLSRIYTDFHQTIRSYISDDGSFPILG